MTAASAYEERGDYDVDVMILPAPGIDASAMSRNLSRATELERARVHVAADAHEVLDLNGPSVVIAVFSSRLGSSFEDLIGLRFAGVPWIAVIPSPHAAVLPDLCRHAGASDVVTGPEVPRRLVSCVEQAIANPTIAPTTSTACFVAMLTHVLGLSTLLEIEGGRGLSAELGVQRGMPWSCRTSDGRRGEQAAIEALTWTASTVRLAELREDGARNIFSTWPDLLRRVPSTTDRNAVAYNMEATDSIPGIRVLHGSPPDVPQPSASQEENIDMAKQVNLSELTDVDGFVGACLVDSDSGMVLGQEGGGHLLNLEVAAAGNTEVVRAKRKTMKSLKLNDKIDDILITLGTQYHLIRPLRNREALFLYLALDRKSSNLAMARMALREFEEGVTV